MFLSRIIVSRLIAWWKIEAKRPSNSPDVVVATSYGTSESRLMVGTEACFRTALNISDSLDGVTIAFSNSDKNGGSHISDFEFSHKLGLMRDNSMLGKAINVIFARPYRGAIEEILLIGDAISLRIRNPKCLMVITGEILSPLTYKVYRKLFPNSEITIVTVPYEVEVQPDSPYFFRRGFVRWFVGNIAMRLALEFFSIKSISKFFSDIA